MRCSAAWNCQSGVKCVMLGARWASEIRRRHGCRWKDMTSVVEKTGRDLMKGRDFREPISWRSIRRMLQRYTADLRDARGDCGRGTAGQGSSSRTICRRSGESSVHRGYVRAMTRAARIADCRTSDARVITSKLASFVSSFPPLYKYQSLGQPFDYALLLTLDEPRSPLRPGCDRFPWRSTRDGNPIRVISLTANSAERSSDSHRFELAVALRSREDLTSCAIPGVYRDTPETLAHRW